MGRTEIMKMEIVLKRQDWEIGGLKECALGVKDWESLRGRCLSSENGIMKLKIFQRVVKVKEELNRYDSVLANQRGMSGWQFLHWNFISAGFQNIRP